MHPLAIWLPAIAGGIAIITAVITILRICFKRMWKPINNFLEDWNGREPRHERGAVPGVMDRLSSLENKVEYNNNKVQGIESEFYRNGGESVRDALDRIEWVLDTSTNGGRNG